jgi:hypothetical protein
VGTSQYRIAELTSATARHCLRFADFSPACAAAMTPPGLVSQFTYFLQAVESSGAPEGIRTPDLCLRASRPVVVMSAFDKAEVGESILL